VTQKTFLLHAVFALCFPCRSYAFKRDSENTRMVCLPYGLSPVWSVSQDPCPVSQDPCLPGPLSPRSLAGVLWQVGRFRGPLPYGLSPVCSVSICLPGPLSPRTLVSQEPGRWRVSGGPFSGPAPVWSVSQGPCLLGPLSPRSLV